MSRPIVVPPCMLAPPNRGHINSNHILGTHVPVEEPSTASEAGAATHIDQSTGGLIAASPIRAGSIIEEMRVNRVFETWVAKGLESGPRSRSDASWTKQSVGGVRDRRQIGRKLHYRQTVALLISARHGLYWAMRQGADLCCDRRD